MLGRKNRTTSLAHTFVARQPLFDVRGDVQGYELLFRAGPLTAAAEDELVQGTLHTLDTAFLVHGIEELTRGLPAYLSFSSATLVDDFAMLFPSDAIAIQIGPYVRFGDDVLNACSRLKRRGYRLVLSDYCHFSWLPPTLLRLIDEVKVDCSEVREDQLEDVVTHFRGQRVQLVAEHLDTQIGWRYARDLGFTRFQGRYLGSPEVVDSPEIVVGKTERLRLLQELNRDDLELDAVEAIIKHDPTLAYKLLMLVNSAALGIRFPITSIRQAITMLGRIGMLRWASVIALNDVAIGRPSELVRESLFRGHFCERVALCASPRLDPNELFLLGLFSQIDLLLSRPLEDIVPVLPVSARLKEALLGESGGFRQLLDLAVCYERGDWDAVDAVALGLGIPDDALPPIYQDALCWSASLSV